MNKELKAKWVEALRSGKYKQGRGNLQNDGCFCCLGVLADIIDPDGWTPYVHDLELFIWKDHEDILPRDVREEIELPQNTVNRLMNLNDNHGLSFNEIADYIEENL